MNIDKQNLETVSEKLTEALQRLSELTAIIKSDELSGKSKMRILSDLVSSYSTYDDMGGGSSRNLYFGKTRDFICLPRQNLPRLNIQVDCFNSRHVG